MAAFPFGGSAGALAASPSFTSITSGTIQNAAITETSGIAASRTNPNVLWIHQDSGAAATVYAITPGGAQLATYSVTGASATDWEDIAVGPGPTAGSQYLYIADIGDNNSVRGSVSVYRVPEPAVSDTQAAVTTSLGGAAKFTFTYPDGARDAESLFVDPLSRDLYIISKRDATKHVYRAPYPQSTSGTTSLELVTTLPNAAWITAADISPDGDEIIMRAGPTNSGLMYTRPAGGSIADALATTPSSIPLLSELQGEAIAFDPQGWGYYTTSEFASAPIHYYNRLPPPAATVYWDNDGVAAGSRASSGAGTGGSGMWSGSALKWYNGSADVAWAAGNNAVFSGTAGTVTLAGGQSVNSVSFKTDGYVLAGSPLTLTGSASITVDAGATTTISAVVAGASGLSKNGAGVLSLTAANTYTGGTTVAAGKVIVIQSLTSSSSLTVQNGATLEVVAGSGATLRAPTLTIGGTGRIDLKNNKLMTQSAIGSAVGGTYTGVTGMIQSAHHGGTWDGYGLVTGMPDALTGLTSLAIATAEQAGVVGGTFGGVSVSSGDVLVMYTYCGDANLDGLISGDDYSAIDFNVAVPDASGWFNGDFNYDGIISGDDYAAIDFNIVAQGAAFPTGAPVGITAVPEPATATAAMMAALLAIPLARRTRRRRSHRSSCRLPR